jgi:hypothetical protein
MMRLFGAKRDGDSPESSGVPAANEQQEPLLNRLVSRQSYGSTASTTSPVRPVDNARSRRRRNRIRTSVYADPPGQFS